MIAAMAHVLASIDPSSIDGSMLSVGAQAAERFRFVVDTLPVPGTFLHFSSVPDLPDIGALQSYWVPEPGDLAEDAFEVVRSHGDVTMAQQPALIGPASEGFPPAIDWVPFVGWMLLWLFVTAASRIVIRFYQKNAEQGATSDDALWWAEHRERLQWVRSMIMAGHPHRALYELEHALEDL